MRLGVERVKVKKKRGVRKVPEARGIVSHGVGRAWNVVDGGPEAKVTL